MNHPEIHVKDWIDVGNRECVVQRLLPPGSPVGACIVVLNKTKRKRKLTAVCSHQTRIGNLDAHLI